MAMPHIDAPAIEPSPDEEIAAAQDLAQRLLDVLDETQAPPWIALTALSGIAGHVIAVASCAEHRDDIRNEFVADLDQVIAHAGREGTA